MLCQNTLVAADAASGDLLGYSVSISNNGSFVLAGAPGKDYNNATDFGAAYYFTTNYAAIVPHIFTTVVPTTIGACEINVVRVDFWYLQPLQHNRRNFVYLGDCDLHGISHGHTHGAGPPCRPATAKKQYLRGHLQVRVLFLLMCCLDIFFYIFLLDAVPNYCDGKPYYPITSLSIFLFLSNRVSSKVCVVLPSRRQSQLYILNMHPNHRNMLRVNATYPANSLFGLCVTIDGIGNTAAVSDAMNKVDFLYWSPGQFPSPF